MFWSGRVDDWRGGAEWERTARAGDDRKYPWGDEPPNKELANFADESWTPHVGHPTPVGLYPHGATPNEIQDLAGNVWEWCSDWFGEAYYAESPPENPPGPEKGERRVVRGGAWGYAPQSLRASDRGGVGPGLRYNYIGFRCAREVFP